MLCCGLSNSRLRKFVKYRRLLVLLSFTGSVVLLFRLGLVFSPFQRNGESDQDIVWQDSSGKINDASGSGQRKKWLKLQTKDPSPQNLLQDVEKIDTSNKVEDRLKKPEQLTEKIHSVGVVEKPYLELLDEINPSHTLQNDKSYPVNKLKKFTQNMNEKLIVFNRDKFPKRPKHGPVVVVQVHKRLEYLVHLLSSLEKAKGIHDVLLVISSDWFSDAIMDAVKQIKFCQVSIFV